MARANNQGWDAQIYDSDLDDPHTAANWERYLVGFSQLLTEGIVKSILAGIDRRRKGQ